MPRYELVGSAAATLPAFLLLQRLLVLRTRAVAPIPATSPTRVLALTGCALAALLASALPTGGIGLVLRSIAVLAALAWFAIADLVDHGRRRPRTTPGPDSVPTRPAL